MSRGARQTELPTGLSGPKKNFYQRDFSSRGTRWSGLLIERLSVPAAKSLTYDLPESIIALQLSRSENQWRARGQYFRETWRPGTTVFQKGGYIVDECATTGWDHIVVTLESKVASQLLGEDESPKLEFLDHVVSFDRQVAGMLTAMEAEAQAGSPAGSVFSQSLSIALIAHLRDRYSRRGMAHRARAQLSPRHVQIVQSYVRANLGHNLNLPELANLLHLSPAYFCRAFAKTTGVTPYRFIMNERVSAAMRQIGSRGEIHPSLWSELGFSSRTHFSSVFRQVVGIPPSEFRQNCR